jgi:phosphohistidine phosphatase SixA
MPFIRLALASILLASASCVTTPSKPTGPNYYVMRHLQKAQGQDPGLSAEGGRNAQLLADMLAADPPAAIYVSATRRARETAAPLAARLGLAPKEYDPSDTPTLLQEVLRETGTVLVVGHSNTVPDIVEGLGGARPPDIGEDQFGDIWHIGGPDRRVEKLTVPPR